MTMREKQILASKKKIILNSSEIQSNVWRFFQIEALLSLKNAWLPPIFFLDTKSTFLVLLSPHSFKPRKNIPVLVGITHRKSRDAQNVCAVVKVGTVLKTYVWLYFLRISTSNS